MVRLGIVVFDGFDELDAIAPWEILRGAAQAGAPFETALFSPSGRETVQASHGLRLTVAAGVPAGLDWLIIPGGGWADGGTRGVRGELDRGHLPRLIRELHAAGVRMASVCTGAMLLSAAGLTRGRPATTHHVARAALAAEGAQLIDARVVDDGDLVTAGGVTSGIDLALWLTERLAGREIADKVAANLEHTRSPRIHLGPRYPP
jgi:transcriptional regulator GlxA family with amidase domain